MSGLEINVGDTVELAARSFLLLSQENPEALSRLIAENDVRGIVTELSPTHIRLRMGTFPDDLVLAVEDSDPFHYLRLIKRRDDPQPLEDMPVQPAFREMSPDEAQEFMSRMGIPGRALGGGVTVGPIMGAGGVLFGPFGQLSQQVHIPQQVVLAHAIYCQLLILRYQSAMYNAQVPGEEWKGKDEMIRALDEPEQRIYEAAIDTVIRWLNKGPG